jgi:hypothetical protein
MRTSLDHIMDGFAAVRDRNVMKVVVEFPEEKR